MRRGCGADGGGAVGCGARCRAAPALSRSAGALSRPARALSRPAGARQARRVKRILLFVAIAGSLVLGVAAFATADVDDFRFASFDASYELSTDEEGRS